VFPVNFTPHLHPLFRVFTYPRPAPLVKARAMFTDAFRSRLYANPPLKHLNSLPSTWVTHPHLWHVLDVFLESTYTTLTPFSPTARIIRLWSDLGAQADCFKSSHEEGIFVERYYVPYNCTSGYRSCSSSRNRESWVGSSISSSSGGGWTVSLFDKDGWSSWGVRSPWYSRKGRKSPLRMISVKWYDPSEMNARPLQGGKILPDMFWDRNAPSSQSRLGLLKVARVPDGNGIDHYRERRCSVELRLISQVVKTYLSAKGDVACQWVQMLPFI